jgi:type VII secretion protein EccE
MPRPAPEVDLRTRPLLIAPPVRPQRPAPVTPATVPAKPTWSRQVREYVERLSPLQVICWQVAALTVLLTVRQPWPVLVGASVAAAVLLALTTVRIGGRWLYELLVLVGGYLSRTRRRDLPETGSTAGRTLALLAVLLPGANIRTLETSQGPAMAISHDGGLTAQLKPNALTPELLNILPMPAALLPAQDGRQHVFGVQEVFHVGVRPDRPRRLWVAVHAARTVDSPADVELTLALRNAMRRVRRALGRAGAPAEPLAEEQALAALAGLAHITGGRTEIREDWRFWRTGSVSQAAFTLTGWDRLADTQARGNVGVLLAGIPGVAATVALWARSDGAARAGRDPRAGATLRLAATTEAAIAAAADTMTDRLAPSGVRLARLDGTHLSGVSASLPIGVFLP